MKIKAVIVDVYNTLLEVSPPPADADARWERLWQRHFNTSPRLSRSEFSSACDRLITREHAAARARGIAHPEVDWPGIVREALPTVTTLTPVEFADFLYDQAQIWHTVQLANGAAAALRQMRQLNLPLGIASNAQAYTLRELQIALAPHGLDLSLFDRDLCFWSFEHGFSKPDPQIFQLLTARLIARGIAPNQTLMVGDRADNDLEPARALGWQTWHLGPAGEGDWAALSRMVG